jgi:hypothetical protein
MAELSAGSAEVVRSKVNELRLVGAPPNHVPDDVFGQSSAPRCSMTAHCSEDPARCDFGGRRPAIHGGFHPSRHRNSPDVAALADQVYDGPVPLPYLQVIHFQTGYSARRNPQPRSTEIIAKSRTDRNPPHLRLATGFAPHRASPVSNPRAQLLHTFDPTNARSEFRTEQPGISGLIG